MGGAFWVACEWALGMRLKTEERVEKEWFRRGEETRSVKTCLLAPGVSSPAIPPWTAGDTDPLGDKTLVSGYAGWCGKGSWLLPCTELF